MSDLVASVQIGVLVLISCAAVASLVVVWWDDHSWLERHGSAAGHLDSLRHPYL